MTKTFARSGHQTPAAISHLALAVTLGLGLAGGVHAQTTPSQTTPSQTTSSQTTAQGDAPEGNDVVIVTGSPVKTKAKKANVSYSVITEEDMSKFTPISADDMLRDLPGVVVETNDGVARNEVFTRGMTVGTGSNTSGYFWTTILEDGLPVVPFKFSGFQDGYFNRTDPSTGRVESVRGGSSATAITTGMGSTFNYITREIKDEAFIIGKLGFEGEDLHQSWKEVQGYFGSRNDAGDFGYSVSGFYRTSNGQVDPGYNLNDGGMIKLNWVKTYETENGTGSFKGTFKHLDDTNAELTAFMQPAYGYENSEPIGNFPRDLDLWLRGGQQTVPNYFEPGTHTLDPSKGFRYKQDAAWVRWDHQTNGRWSFGGNFRLNKSTYRGQGYKPQDLVSLDSAAAMRDRFGLNINNLDRTPGYFELYDENNTLMARVANNVNGSQQGTNYRTGAACARVTSTTAAGRCITYNILPNRDIDMRGGVVTATTPLANGTYPSGTVPSESSTRDLVMQTRIEDNYRESRDAEAAFTANWTGDYWSFNFGAYAAKSDQVNQNWANGLGLSAWGNGEVQNLNVRYVTNTGTTYQLTDAGGWGNYGTGLFTTVNQRATIAEFSPYAGVSWSDGRWDVNFSIKNSHFSARTYSETWDLRDPSASSLAYGGLDGNPLTVYDNVKMIKNPTKVIEADKEVSITNWSLSAGYNFSARQKVYYRYLDAKQPAMGIINRYPTTATLVRPLGPTGLITGHEIAYIFGDRQFNGQVTYFYQNFAINDYPTAIDTDNVSTYLLPENFNTNFTRGVEAWFKWKVTSNLDWQSSVTYLNGKATETYTWLNTGANGQGQADDVLRIDSGILARTPNWTISNTVSYKWDDFRFNFRHRWMDKRKLNNNALDHRYLPTQDNLDISVQYDGLKKTQITLDIRNALDTQYISAYNPMITSGYPTNVQQYDVVEQLPNSGFLLRRNAPRSVWLTVKHSF